LTNKTYILQRSLWVPRPIDEIFAFFSRAANLETITPAFLKFRITESPEEICQGSRIKYVLRLHGIPVRWATEIVTWEPPRRFVDVQLSGPYSLWHHEHRFTEERGGTRLQDEVRYALPFGLLGQVAHWVTVRRDVEDIFAYREEKIKEMFGDEAKQ
jgi:ligand-binding SRPBCC domain-containing protein